MSPHPHTIRAPPAQKTSKFVFTFQLRFYNGIPFLYHDFLPKFLFHNVFSKIAYLYFMLISALQIFTDLSPTGKFTTAGPLALMVGIRCAAAAKRQNAASAARPAPTPCHPAPHPALTRCLCVTCAQYDPRGARGLQAA